MPTGRTDQTQDAELARLRLENRRLRAALEAVAVSASYGLEPASSSDDDELSPSSGR